jgi:riboflavin biosynthesis pyrimidine reductase
MPSTIELSAAWPWLIQLGAEPEDTILRTLYAYQLEAAKADRPWFVTLSFAHSLDGKIDARPNASAGPLRLSSARAQRLTHALRAMHHAVAVGWNTLVADDPLLTVRCGVPGNHTPPGWKQPRPVVLCPHEALREDLLKQSRLWRERGDQLILVPREASWPSAVCAPSLFVEGGSRVISSLLSATSNDCSAGRRCDLVIATIVPCWVGDGASSVPAFVLPSAEQSMPRLCKLQCWMLDDELVLLGMRSPETSSTAI